MSKKLSKDEKIDRAVKRVNNAFLSATKSYNLDSNDALYITTLFVANMVHVISITADISEEEVVKAIGEGTIECLKNAIKMGLYDSK